MKKLSDESYRIVNYVLENMEIKELIRTKILKEFTTYEGDKFEYRFDFVEEGSPAYKTDKIKCTVTIKRNLNELK